MWEQAANAIRTTDTFPKGSYSKVGDSESYIAGIAKGSGMIAPSMATMLAFIFHRYGNKPERITSIY